MRADPEALLFGLAWAALALFAGFTTDWRAGALIAVGLMLLIVPAGMWATTRFDSGAPERVLRWSLLATAAVAFLVWKA